MRTLARVAARRYVTPLKEGGSLPAVVDTDAGLYVVKFRGAGQGARALIAEILVAGLAEALELPVPELALIELDESFGRSERDPEIRDILRGSVGTNVGMRYLDGAFNFDPAADTVSEEVASRLVWLDAFASNVDRTARNPNLMWSAEQALWLIDHGAALYFHHSWESLTPERAADPFALSSEHVLLGRATDLEAADRVAREALERSGFDQILERVPDELLMDSLAGSPPPFESATANRRAYGDYFRRRLESSGAFVEAAMRARQEKAQSAPRNQGYRR